MVGDLGVITAAISCSTKSSCDEARLRGIDRHFGIKVISVLLLLSLLLFAFFISTITSDEYFTSLGIVSKWQLDKLQSLVVVR